MKTEILHSKLDRYLSGNAAPAEKRQIQSWLSVTTTDSDEFELTAEEKAIVGEEILSEIKAHTAYPLFYPREEKRWWQRAVAAFF